MEEKSLREPQKGQKKGKKAPQKEKKWGEEARGPSLSDPGATQSGAEWVADEASRLAGGTVAVYGKGAARIKELLAERGISATEVAAPAGAARVSPQVTTTLDVCATVKNGTVRARVDVVPKRRSGDPFPAPETVTVGRYKRESGLAPIVKARGAAHFVELTAAGKAAWIYLILDDQTLSNNNDPILVDRPNGKFPEFGRMFNRHVQISELECPANFEVASGADWEELRDELVNKLPSSETDLSKAFSGPFAFRGSYVTEQGDGAFRSDEMLGIWRTNSATNDGLFVASAMYTPGTTPGVVAKIGQSVDGIIHHIGYGVPVRLIEKRAP